MTEQATLGDEQFVPWEERGGVRYGDDPTKQVLGESALNGKELCDYNINVAVGCRHGCQFCYVPATPNVRTRTKMLHRKAGVDDHQEEWGSYVLHRDPDETEAKLRSVLEGKRSWRETPGGRGVVAMSFGTDCFQDRHTADVTARCMAALFDHGKHVRILTRNPNLALHHVDVFERGAEQGLVTVGTSLPCLSGEDVRAIERGAPHPETRLQGLEAFADAGVPTFVSMSPTYPHLGTWDLYDMLRAFRDRLDTLDVVFHEAINPRGGNFELTVQAARANDRGSLARALERISESREEWRQYAVTHLRTVQQAADDLGVPLKSWPGKDLVRACEGTIDERWVRGAYMARSPEQFANNADDQQTTQESDN